MTDVPGISRRSRPGEAAIVGLGVTLTLLVLDAGVDLVSMLPAWIDQASVSPEQQQMMSRQFALTLGSMVTLPATIGLGVFLALWLLVGIRPEHSFPTVVARSLLVTAVALVVCCLGVLLLQWLSAFIGSGWSESAVTGLPPLHVVVQGLRFTVSTLPLIVLAVVCLWQWRRYREERRPASAGAP